MNLGPTTSPVASSPSTSSSTHNQSLHQALKLVFECGVKLDAKLETMASAAIFFHKFYKINSPARYDPCLIGATCIYLAGKVEEDHLKLRDIINVFNATLDKVNKRTPLQFDDHYWGLRESLVQLELLMLRFLKFDVNNIHPHRFLLHYLRSLTEWIGNDYQSTISFCQTCWALLNDYYMDPRCIDHAPHYIAIAVIQIALEMHDIQIPYNEEALLGWNEAFCEDMSNEKIWKIISNILSLYEEDEKEAFKKVTTIDLSPRTVSTPEECPSRQYMPSKVIEYTSKYSKS